MSSILESSAKYEISVNKKISVSYLKFEFSNHIIDAFNALIIGNLFSL